MKIIFAFHLFVLTAMTGMSQTSNVKIAGCWKVNYFANASENTSNFPESIQMIYQFLVNGEYIYSVSDNATNTKNEQKGKYQISSNSLILKVDDVILNCSIFRMTENEVVFKTTVEDEELFFIMNKINCK